MLEKRYTAILCDDETSLLELLQNSIEWKKMNIDIVATARDGKKSVEEIVSCQPDFAILDINMPI
jgi:YesN/AraC family two-component response regulator